MNRIFLTGNLTRDPETRTTHNGTAVCNFTVAVNRRKAGEGQPEADFFRIVAWRGLADNCQRYLAKGRKVAVVGTLTLQTYTGNDGQARSSLEVTADEVEFLSPREPAQDPIPPIDSQTGFVQVDDGEDSLPF